MARRISARRPSSSTDSGAHGGPERLMVQALTKGLAVLNLFDTISPELSVDEMAYRAGFPRMTVYRLARTLESSGYLVGDRTTNRYHLGPAIMAATRLSYERHADLVRVARPHLEELSRRTEETISLAVEVDGVAVEVDGIPARRPFKPQLAPGRIVGYTASAHGKVFAAHMSPAELERMLEAPLHLPAPHKPTDPESLSRELEQVRRDGIAFDFEERAVGTCAVAAPIYDQVGDVIASIGVIVPPGRFGESERRSLVDAVKEQAASLSAYFGYRASASAG